MNTTPQQTRGTLVVSCLQCGARRKTRISESGGLSVPRCHWCGETGWNDAGAVAWPDAGFSTRHHCQRRRLAR